MAQRPEHLQDVPLKDLRDHPEMVMDLLSADGDVSVVLQKRGDTVRVGAMKTYSEKAVRIAAEARAEHAERADPTALTPQRLAGPAGFRVS